jgi:superoxide dismutase
MKALTRELSFHAGSTASTHSPGRILQQREREAVACRMADLPRAINAEYGSLARFRTEFTQERLVPKVPCGLCSPA